MENKIVVLPPDVAALIAAGEVVERPSSVVKELVENSMDAGAGSITVEIKNGGVSYIRVTDDGSGIGAQDVPSAFLRHATSKISKAEDLDGILTLGFRGEALYSIAMVSTLEMLTAVRGENEGTFVKVSAGEVLEISPAGCPAGTTIIVRGLFFNTPARMKFLKRDSTEAGYIEDNLRKLALGRPDISFKYINNGKEVFFTPGDNSLKNAVYAIYGRDMAGAMVEAEYEGDGVTVCGLVGKSGLTRPNRSFQTFFVNGRCVINKSFYVALMEAYKNQIMSGRFPVAVLNITINPSLCDVNVHPAKIEIKFANDKPVFGGVYWAAKNALYNITQNREFEVATPVASTPEPSKSIDTKVSESEAAFIPEQMPVKPPIYKTTVYEPKPKVSDDISQMPIPNIPDEISQMPIPNSNNSVDIKLVGQIFGTYIVAQSGDNMLLLDQHAAHERLIYNRIIKEKDAGEVFSQVLMMPEVVQLSAVEFAIWQEQSTFLRSIGFDFQEFGHNTVRITGVPITLALGDISVAFTEVLNLLANPRAEIQTAAQDEALYRIACHGAMRAGKNLSTAEQEELIKQVMALPGEATCPHGRPVILEISKYKLEKQFKRIV